MRSATSAAFVAHAASRTVSRCPLRRYKSLQSPALRTWCLEPQCWRATMMGYGADRSAAPHWPAPTWLTLPPAARYRATVMEPLAGQRETDAVTVRYAGYREERVRLPPCAAASCPQVTVSRTLVRAQSVSAADVAVCPWTEAMDSSARQSEGGALCVAAHTAAQLERRRTGRGCRQ